MKHNICTWNVRGLNDPLKIGEIRKLISSNNIQIIALVETRVKMHNFNKVSIKFGNCFQWVNNYYQMNDRGRNIKAAGERASAKAYSVNSAVACYSSDIL